MIDWSCTILPLIIKVNDCLNIYKILFWWSQNHFITSHAIAYHLLPSWCNFHKIMSIIHQSQDPNFLYLHFSHFTLNKSHPTLHLFYLSTFLLGFWSFTNQYACIETLPFRNSTLLPIYYLAGINLRKKDEKFRNLMNPIWNWVRVRAIA